MPHALQDSPATSACVYLRVPPSPQPVVASSLQAVLEQALQTQDDAQLEYCLAVKDTSVIETTVARLPTPKVIPFLSRIVQRFERRPAHSLELVAWLRAVLVQHASFLMSVPGLMRKMSRLYQVSAPEDWLLCPICCRLTAAPHVSPCTRPWTRVSRCTPSC